MLTSQTNHLMPREKLLQQGAESLSDQELLAIFLRTGIKNCPVIQLATHALQHFGSLYHLLSAPLENFCEVKGLGKTQFIQLQACVEMTKRYLNQELSERTLFDNPQITKLYLQTELARREREMFMVLFLDNQHFLIKKETLFLGTINSATVHPREIIKSALFCNAAAIILAHNHPSGKTQPSSEDIYITQKINQACELIEVRLLDHIIIGQGEPFSLAENAMLY
ncbi:hypothetical protein CEP45_08325 [Mergibacter septicus]|uniref:RadC family protein n=1 Tax=Mergibacter septicus TaxID=221402 RepID=UPI001C754AEC|nr:DNA repair protein RadC [Mergibacter septicus]QDJ13830.1 hypothetical protein CEP45_08325 [Mergibacter septicus]